MTKVLTMEKAAGRPVGREYAPEVKVVNFTPTLAEAILNNNRLNRPLREGRVEKYARDMAAGRWRMNAETIKLTRTGDLLDGQHRMFAVIEAVNLMAKGKSLPPIPMMVVEGLDEDVMPTIDTGAARTFADVLTIEGRGEEGSAKNTMLVAAAVKWLHWYVNGHQGSLSRLRPTHSELHVLLEKNADVMARASEIQGKRYAKRMVTPSVLTFVYTLAFRSDPAKAGGWLGLLDTVSNLDTVSVEKNHPVLQLVKRMIDNRSARAKLPLTDVAALIVKSWNQTKTGKRTNTLTWKSTEAFPEVL
jgi:hypothetical protein